MGVTAKFQGRYLWNLKATGEAAAFDIPLPFKARVVEVENITTASLFKWSEAYDAAKGVSLIDTGAGATDIAAVAANGISASNGGIRLGTAIQTTSDDLRITVWK